MAVSARSLHGETVADCAVDLQEARIPRPPYSKSSNSGRDMSVMQQHPTRLHLREPARPNFEICSKARIGSCNDPIVQVSSQSQLSNMAFNYYFVKARMRTRRQRPKVEFCFHGCDYRDGTHATTEIGRCKHPRNHQTDAVQAASGSRTRTTASIAGGLPG